MTPLSPTITMARERYVECLDDVRPLLEAHWKEIAHYQDIPLDPLWRVYDELDEAGQLYIYTLRERGALRGYAVFMVGPNAHYQSSLQAVQDVLYLEPEYRRQMIGARFLEWCDEQLRAAGVQVVYHHVKFTHDFGLTLARLGYDKIETVWGRRLDR